MICPVICSGLLFMHVAKCKCFLFPVGRSMTDICGPIVCSFRGALITLLGGVCADCLMVVKTRLNVNSAIVSKWGPLTQILCNLNTHRHTCTDIHTHKFIVYIWNAGIKFRRENTPSSPKYLCTVCSSHTETQTHVHTSSAPADYNASEMEDDRRSRSLINSSSWQGNCSAYQR